MGGTNTTGLSREARRLLRPFWPVVAAVTVIGVIGGAATGTLLASVNRGLHQEGGVSRQFLLQFAGLCFLVLGGRVVAGIGNSTVGQQLIARMRKEVSARILDVPLAAIEQFRPHRILTALNDDIDNVSAFTFNISTYLISAAVVIGCFIYLAVLSPWLFPVAMLALGFGLWLNFATRRRWNGYYADVRVAQDDLQKQYRAIAEGAKELRLNGDRRSHVHGRLLSDAADRISMLKIRAMRLYWSADAMGSTLFFVVIGVLLALKGSLGISSATLTGFVITLLFVKGPIDQILLGIPSATQALISLGRLSELTDMLEGEPSTPASTAKALGAFETIELRDVRFQFPSEHGFALGPINLTIRRGEALFLVGENGSGKTTLLKLLSGLYSPMEGELLVDGRPVSIRDRQAFAGLFATVFSDYFLFEELPPGGQVLTDRASRYLKRFELEDKVAVRNGSFSTIDLSTGQRKRLALIQAWLEDRPVMMFDEWAADQDPAFRRIFYNEVLPELKRLGKTLIVVSHDDRFFDAADRLLQLHRGRLESGEDVGARVVDADT